MAAVPSLYVRRRKDSDILEPVRPADAIEIKKLPEGRPLKCKLSKPRNSKVHRLYFAAIAAAAKHWPEGEEPDPKGDAECLRAYLQCRANWCKNIPFPLSAKQSVIELIQDVRAKDRFAFVSPGIVDKQPGLIVSVPFSIDYESADDAEFEKVKTAVLGMIEAAIGVDIMTLVKEAENEA